MRELSFEDMQTTCGAIAAMPPRKAPQKMPAFVMRTVRDGAEQRAELIAAGVLRASASPLNRSRSLPTFQLDTAALDDAALQIFFGSASERQLEARIEQAEPRIASRLEALRAKRAARGAA